jgi:large subunit ribosomal protein L24
MGIRLRKDDEVIVIAGASKGQTGRVLSVTDDGRVIIEGVNVTKRHQSPRKYREAGIIEREAPIDASNVMLYNPATDQGDRVGYKFLEDGRKVRFFRSTGEVVDI